MQILYSFWNLLHAVLFIFYFSQSPLSNNQATKWRSEWGRHFVTVSLKAQPNNGNLPNEKKPSEEPRGACSTTMMELLSKPFISLHSEAKTKPCWEATWHNFTRAQVKPSLRHPLSNTVTAPGAARHPSEQALLCPCLLCAIWTQDHPLTASQSL